MCHNDIPARMSSANNVFYIIFNKKMYIENGMECQETQKVIFIISFIIHFSKQNCAQI